jgi:hypothetical protein
MHHHKHQLQCEKNFPTSFCYWQSIISLAEAFTADMVFALRDVTVCKQCCSGETGSLHVPCNLPS